LTIAAREFHLKSRPVGAAGLDNFELVERELPDLAEGQLLVRALWMSVDPYMRGRMNEGPSYIAPFAIGKPLEGDAIGVVEESRDARFRPGYLVKHFFGWRDVAVVDAEGVTRVDPSAAPLPAWLGPLGIPGLTAWAGLLHIARLKEGETVFVSGAAGAVGSIALQIARIKGARVIASVGSPAKARWVKDELGADAVIDYKNHATSGDLARALAKAAPQGIDVYFDNVGGDHLEAALAVANNFARFAICGMIALYNDAAPQPGPRNMTALIVKRITLKGYMILDHLDLIPAFNSEMIGWLREGKIKSRETIVEGLENAPKAFLGLFSGDNTGKMLVKIAEG
jgi:NADPH-dependent curcumin reductase CurA